MQLYKHHHMPRACGTAASYYTAVRTYTLPLQQKQQQLGLLHVAHAVIVFFVVSL